MKPALRIELPEWLTTACRDCGPLATDAERMGFVVDLSRRNVETHSGGPFAAAVFEIDSGRLVAAATNLVVASHCSAAHAEVLALSFAQQALGRHDLGAEGLPAMELVGSCEPCAMCLGALGWSGVRRVVCAATGGDAETIGFDEGPKPADWAGELRRRDIEVVEGVLRAEAVAVLLTYRQLGGMIYNARSGGSA
ncbi:MAG: nucleoside deaminase [Gammaproteobacteria bacterium]|nr:nucleoside deaminase [Gammaproteobacteria bacterium]MBU1414624.1 nucleoside deaminase [Gammaproteobacteria bacterium]